MAEEISTKKILLNAARTIIETKGVDGLSMRPLGKKCGLSRSALYRHFKNREDLLSEIALDNFRQLLNFFNQTEKKILDLKDQLFKCLEQLFFLGYKYPEHYRLMFSKKWGEESIKKLSESRESVSDFFKVKIQKIRGNIEISQNIIRKESMIIEFFIHGLTDSYIKGNSPSKPSKEETADLIHQLLSALNLDRDSSV